MFSSTSKICITVPILAGLITFACGFMCGRFLAKDTDEMRGCYKYDKWAIEKNELIHCEDMILQSKGFRMSEKTL